MRNALLNAYDHSTLPDGGDLPSDLDRLATVAKVIHDAYSEAEYAEERTRKDIRHPLDSEMERRAAEIRPELRAVTSALWDAWQRLEAAAEPRIQALMAQRTCECCGAPLDGDTCPACDRDEPSEPWYVCPQCSTALAPSEGMGHSEGLIVECACGAKYGYGYVAGGVMIANHVPELAPRWHLFNVTRKRTNAESLGLWEPVDLPTKTHQPEGPETEDISAVRGGTTEWT